MVVYREETGGADIYGRVDSGDLGCLNRVDIGFKGKTAGRLQVGCFGAAESATTASRDTAPPRQRVYYVLW